MSRTRRFIGGVSFGYVNQFLVMLAGLWLTPFLLGRVGQHDYGLWLVGAQVLAYLSLLDFGVIALLPRETAYASGRARGEGVRDEMSRLVGQTTRLVLWQTPLVAAAAAGCWLLMPAEWGPLGRPLAFVLLAFVVTFPLRAFPAVLQGLQDFEFLAKTQLCTWALSVALTVALALAGFGLYALAAGWAAPQLLSVPVYLYRLRRRFPDVLPARLPRLPWAEARRKLTAGFYVSVAQVAVALIYGTDVLVIGKLLGPAVVVPYVCTLKLAQVLANQPQMLMQLAMPALSELRAGGSGEQLTRVCVALSQMMLLVSGGVVCVILAVNRGFVGWWVGAEQFGGATLTALALLGMMLRHWNLTIGYVLFAFGFERRLAVASLLDGLVNVAASIVLVPRLGLLGAPVGMLLGVCLVSLPINMWALSATRSIAVKDILRALAPWFWRFAALALASAVVGVKVAPENFAGVAAVALLAAVVYAAVMLPIARRDPLGVYVRPLLASLGGRLSRAFLRRSPALGE